MPDLGGQIGAQAAVLGQQASQSGNTGAVGTEGGAVSQLINSNEPTVGQPFTLKTQGWYIAAGITVAIMLANTQAGPFLLGILGVALIWQFGMLLQHK